MGSISSSISLIATTFIFDFIPFQIKAVLMNVGLVGVINPALSKGKVNWLKDIFNNQNLNSNKK